MIDVAWCGLDAANKAGCVESETAKARIPYFPCEFKMLAKLTSKNQPTAPKSITAAVAQAEYFDGQPATGKLF